MAETVFILGAGASHEAGAPLMKDFLDEAQRLSKSERIPSEDFDLVLNARNQLLAAHSNAVIDFRNLESLFAAFEMARLLGRLGTMDVEDVNRLSDAMERLITQTLGATMGFTIDHNNRSLEPPFAFKAFASLLRLMRRSKAKAAAPVSVLTFNYDPCVDYALYTAGLNPNYCLDGDRDDGVSLLKLHGSMNWTICKQCGKVTWWSIGKHLATRQFDDDEIADIGDRALPLARFLAGTYEYQCKHRGPCNPLIIPPTYNKGHRHTDVERVWKTAAEELREAENIYVMGFSLPDTDQFFRYFCALGMMGSAYMKQRFWVFDPSKEVEGRFKSWLGQDANSIFKYHQSTFSEATGILSREINP
jgi:NAD-dependent SIR2 family protein deacetylase